MRAVPFAFLYLAATTFASTSTSVASEIAELRGSYEFLVRDRADGGVVFKLAASDGGYALPASFRDSADYWGQYVCQTPGTSCAVTDSYNANTYQLTPAAGAAGELQTERVNVHNGANIYDAATWQIAVVLGGVKNRFPAPRGTTAYALAENVNKMHAHSGLATHTGAAPGTKRATTAGSTFTYNGTEIIDGKSAYAFRAIAPAYLARDPLMGTRYAAVIKATGLPASDASYEPGKITWSDWKPLTGENAWAFFIGPLQAAYIHYVIGDKKPAIPLHDLAIQNALDVLPAFAAMQSKTGGVYYAPAGTIGNQGTQPVPPYEVSVENNFSLYAGLQILRATLRAHTKLSNNDKIDVERALQIIDRMIDGDAGTSTPGLLSFFQTMAWQNGAFVQGGLANDPAQKRDWAPSPGPRAVDVQTWGIAALGAKRIDDWFGHGAAFKLWQNVKSWGAYGVDKTLWGVGYSDRDGNGLAPSGSYKQGVMSVEWTAGAINAVRNMISTYNAEPLASPTHAKAMEYVARLRQDEAGMLSAIQKLRIDRYAATPFPGKPENYAALMPEKTKPYLYASKRYQIPFGWYANPLPSTASTAWMMMLANAYDPFGFGGSAN